ncbi:MAG: uracil phosphoribosyltransferase, partial [Saprospiraceae bacterium]
YGIEQVRRFFPKARIWAGAIDEELTAKSYIVPGLGDAGDLSYGSKLQE